MTPPRFLTLGDGDFSYSLDLVRYLSTIEEKQQQTTIIATGIDSLEEMKEKYKDCTYILRQLTNHSGEKTIVKIEHEVNAVVASEKHLSAEVVIFNHPHLGTEDAARHRRFLHHFFYECKRSWIKPTTTQQKQQQQNNNNHGGGTIHLTLVEGQWKRWNGEKAATKHGFELKHRFPFKPPPVKGGSNYQFRRHQTGRSFHNRTLGSETFVLVPKSHNSDVFLFPWQKTMTKGNKIKVVCNFLEQQPQYTCLDCDRSFRERRSLISHAKALHFMDDDDDKKKKRKREENIRCEECFATTGIVKLFQHQQALIDHKNAKHSGIHTFPILPDWAGKNKTTTPPPEQQEDYNDAAEEKKENGEIFFFGHCDVCDYAYSNMEDKIFHLNEFLPVKGVLCPKLYVCSLCDKAFHEKRALLQHENCCILKHRCREKMENVN